MPRPKRTKVAYSIAVAPARVAKASKVAAPIRQQQTTRKAVACESSISDDSDGLVVRATRPRRARMPYDLEPEKDVDLSMTGALPEYDADENLDDNLNEKVEGRQGFSLPEESQSTSKTTPWSGRRTPRSTSSQRSRATAQSRNSVAEEEVLAEIPITINAHNALLEEDETSLLDPSLLSFGSLDSDSPAHGTRPPSAMKVGGTPAHETSILALKNFRRRTRQPSLLRMVQQTTDVEDNDLDDFEDLDDFRPDDESTPVHGRKSGGGEDITNEGERGLSSTSSRGKKRKLSSPVIQVPRSSPPFDPPSGSDIEISRRSLSPSLPDVVESREEIVEVAQTQEQEHPDCMSETMAPPRSSSPPGEEFEESPVTPRLRRRRAVSTRTEGQSNSEEEIRERPATRKGRQNAKAKSLSTAKLQALLPRRRTRIPAVQNVFDIRDSDDLDGTNIESDQDELQLPPPRQVSNRKSATAKKKRPVRAVKKSAMPAATTKKSRKTYSRRTSSDKENGSTFVDEGSYEDVDESAEATTKAPKNKLAAISKKFEDVDAWEMEFEIVDVGGENSSPWR